MGFIFEMPVYCGRLKVWRVLNLNSGTIYSMDFETEAEAIGSIEDGEERAGCLVKRVNVHEVRALLDRQSICG